MTAGLDADGLVALLERLRAIGCDEVAFGPEGVRVRFLPAPPPPASAGLEVERGQGAQLDALSRAGAGLPLPGADEEELEVYEEQAAEALKAVRRMKKEQAYRGG